MNQSSSAAPDHSTAWAAVAAARDTLQARNTRITELFSADPGRQAAYCLEACGIVHDHSRELLSDEARAAMLALAAAQQLPAAIAAMFAGEAINSSEARPALHVALRSPHQETPEEILVHQTLARMQSFVTAVQEGRWRGFRGDAIRDVVNIGIGGSDLGPAMVYEALRPYRLPELRCHFVSNADPLHLEQTLAGLDPARTLFIVASKSFNTLETSLNAESARAWLYAQGASHADLARHFVAVSANVDKAAAFGIDPDNIFPLWDWVGGRYSLWSAIGLPLALGLGMGRFQALLAGAHAMDEHFRTAPLASNLPLLMALLDLWYSNFWGAQTKVVLPYAQNLQLLPAFLQQLDMESLGKRVDRDGRPLDCASGSILWGSAGTNGQHSFHQLLHQGTHLIPADFILIARSHSGNDPHHQHLLANGLAQSQALLQGMDLQQAEAELLARGLAPEAARALAPHKVIPGSRPSSTLLLEALTPSSLGSLVALYEHKVYAHASLLGINAFDQWGVELGKVLGQGVYQALQEDGLCTQFDPSTNAMVNRLKRH